VILRCCLVCAVCNVSRAYLTGLASSTVPMYIAECAPSHQRGKLVTINNTFITGGQFIASVVAGAFSYDHNTGWRFESSVVMSSSLAGFWHTFSLDIVSPS